MRLIDRLKESYQNGGKEKVLLKKKAAYYSALDNGFQGDMFYEGIVRVNNKIDAIPKPRGFLEEVAYALGIS